MLRRLVPLLAVGVAVASWVGPTRGPTAPRPAAAAPVATSDPTYTALGRVFPDPHGCRKGLPGSSPWAKGTVCATTFLQWDETLAGLRYLQTKFPRFAELVNLRDLKTKVPEFSELDMQSAGLAKSDFTRDRRDLYVFVVTDRESPIPSADRKRFAYSLSIHGVERAGLEGGIRAAEDLITWAATAPKTKILEPTNSGPAAGDVLKQSVLYFVLSNPDGWNRGDVTKGGVYYQRYNGNGTDLNRDWPGIGFLNPIYTNSSEPEVKGYSAYLKRERALAGGEPFAGSMDLHGMNGAPSFSYTMLPGGNRDFQKNADTIRATRAVYDDSVRRLAYSPLIAAPPNCPGNVPVFLLVSSGSAPMCPDQWGTVWDTINYQTTGSVSEWMDGPIGLDAIGLDNEMAYSHISVNNNFIPELEQLHIDGNKGLIYAQLATILDPKPVSFPLPAPTGFVPTVNRLSASYSTVSAATAFLPVQPGLDLRELRGGGIEFDVKGPADGFRNEGMAAEFTFTSVDGMSTDSFSSVVLQRFGIEHPGETEGWHDVGAWYRQEPTYVPGGARIDINHPRPGRYRLEPDNARLVATQMRVTFTGSPTVPQRTEGGYNVGNTDALAALRGPNNTQLAPVTAAQILGGSSPLPGLSSFVLADDPAPGVPAASRKLWFERLGNWVNGGGNLVLTDGALQALSELGVIPAAAVTRGIAYGGWVSFTDTGTSATFAKHPLAAGIDLPGAANGNGSGLTLRRQTYDPSAVGYFIDESTGSDCNNSSVHCDAPQWIIDPAAWAKAGGSIAGRSAVYVGKTGSLTQKTGVALGDLAYGAGRIRIAGALLPTPTDTNNHPYGLTSHGLTYVGYQLLVNLLDTKARVVVGAAGVSRIPATSAAPSAAPVAAVALALTLVVRRVRLHRRA